MGEEQGVVTGKETERGSWAASAVMLTRCVYCVLSPQQGFPGGSGVKTWSANAGEVGSIPGSGRFPGEGNGNLLQVFLPGKSHGQKSLVGYSPCSRKESDTT